MKNILGNEIETIALFTNFKFVKQVKSEGSLLQDVCSHQFRNGTTTSQVYTALSVKRGLAFSQEYKKIPPGKCSHGAMFKHEYGVTNPCDPSFRDLVMQLPVSEMPEPQELLPA